MPSAPASLQHDYHDNLYVLLRGKKRFRLYPPSQAERMYVHGELAVVHPNGRIVHKSQVGGSWRGRGTGQAWAWTGLLAGGFKEQDGVSVCAWGV